MILTVLDNQRTVTVTHTLYKGLFSDCRTQYTLSYREKHISPRALALLIYLPCYPTCTVYVGYNYNLVQLHGYEW